MTNTRKEAEHLQGLEDRCMALQGCGNALRGPFFVGDGGYAQRCINQLRIRSLSGRGLIVDMHLRYLMEETDRAAAGANKYLEN